MSMDLRSLLGTLQYGSIYALFSFFYDMVDLGADDDSMKLYIIVIISSYFNNCLIFGKTLLKWNLKISVKEYQQIYFYEN